MTPFETFKTKASSNLSSVGAVNNFAIDKLEAILKLNLETAAFFAEIGIKQLRAAAGIKDVETMRGFAADSISTSGEIGKRVFNDCKSWLHLGQEVNGEVADLMAEAEIIEAPKKSIKAALLQ